MPVPDKVRYLLEALRGGGTTTFRDGKMVKQEYGPARTRPATQQMMPTGLRGYQLHNAEAAAEGTKGATYAEWMKERN